MLVQFELGSGIKPNNFLSNFGSDLTDNAVKEDPYTVFHFEFLSVQKPDWFRIRSLFLGNKFICAKRPQGFNLRSIKGKSKRCYFRLVPFKKDSKHYWVQNVATRKNIHFYPISNMPSELSLIQLHRITLKNLGELGIDFHSYQVHTPGPPAPKVNEYNYSPSLLVYLQYLMQKKYLFM